MKQAIKRTDLETLVRSIVEDMNSCYLCKRVSWTREEVYPLIIEIERLRAMKGEAQSRPPTLAQNVEEHFQKWCEEVYGFSGDDPELLFPRKEVVAFSSSVLEQQAAAQTSRIAEAAEGFENWWWLKQPKLPHMGEDQLSLLIDVARDSWNRAVAIADGQGEPQQAAEVVRLREANERLTGLLNTPETDDFDKGVPLEAAHQVQRWGAEHDAGKTPMDWFWLVGYLAGKCLASHLAGNKEKALHHTISTAAVMRNWHAAISNEGSFMRPGISAEARAAIAGTEEGK